MFLKQYGLKNKNSGNWIRNRWHRTILICWSLEGLLYILWCILPFQSPNSRQWVPVDTKKIARMYQERQKRYLGTLSAIGNVLSIEEKFDIKDQFNPCNLILPGMPSCEEQQCLWSAWLQKHVDMRFKPLHFTEGKSCLWPMGGQLNPPKSNDIDKVSFIITFQEPIPILYQCILHVFLDSRYAPSAEMILVQDGPSESRRVKKLAEALTLAFGFEIKYIQNEKTLGMNGMLSRPSYNIFNCW